jgi:G:T/U-mismatch repair DNA glycosylase
MRIKHKLYGREVNADTKILIVGTFNPDCVRNEADFFYGRGRNYLWQLLPAAFGDQELKTATKQEKEKYIKSKNIDFIDLISETNLEIPLNYNDDYIDKKVVEWRDVIAEIPKLKELKKVGFTRRSFSPKTSKIKSKAEEIERYCEGKGIFFQKLTTPSRFYNEEKQAEWTRFLTENI